MRLLAPAGPARICSPEQYPMPIRADWPALFLRSRSTCDMALTAENSPPRPGALTRPSLAGTSDGAGGPSPRIRAIAARQKRPLAHGDFKFVLDGQRLHGSWVLVRMKHDQTGDKRTIGPSSSTKTNLPVTETETPFWPITGRSPPAADGGHRGRKGPRTQALHDRDEGCGRSRYRVGQQQGPDVGSAPATPIDTKPAPAASPARHELSVGLPEFIPPQLCHSVDG
jgi:hypothetical protein